MGLYNIKCTGCSENFVWFSGVPEQICEKCKMKHKKEDASVNSLGAMPNGRLVSRGKPKKSKLKGESNMSLAKKYLKALFEDDMPQDEMPPQEEPMDDAPMDAAPVEPMDAHMEDMKALCADMEAAVNELEGDAKDKMMPLLDKLKAMCEPKSEEPSEEPPMEEPADDESPEEAMKKKAKSQDQHMKPKMMKSEAPKHQQVKQETAPVVEPVTPPVVETKVEAKTYPWQQTQNG